MKTQTRTPARGPAATQLELPSLANQQAHPKPCAPPAHAHHNANLPPPPTAPRAARLPLPLLAAVLLASATALSARIAAATPPPPDPAEAHAHRADLPPRTLRAHLSARRDARIERRRLRPLPQRLARAAPRADPSPSAAGGALEPHQVPPPPHRFRAFLLRLRAPFAALDIGHAGDRAPRLRRPFRRPPPEPVDQDAPRETAPLAPGFNRPRP